MARKMKIAIPILTDEELINIDENWQSMAEKFVQETMHEKDLCIAHRIIKKQQEEIERLSNELNQQFIKCDKYMTRNEKAIEYVNILNEQDMTLDEKECLLEILKGENK